MSRRPKCDEVTTVYKIVEHTMWQRHWHLVSFTLPGEWTRVYEVRSRTMPVEGSYLYAFRTQEQARRYRLEVLGDVRTYHVYRAKALVIARPPYCTIDLGNYLTDFWRIVRSGKRMRNSTYVAHSIPGTVWCQWIELQEEVVSPKSSEVVV